MSGRTLSCSPTTVDSLSTLSTSTEYEPPGATSESLSDVPTGPTPVTLRSAGQYDFGRSLEPCTFFDTQQFKESECSGGETVQVLTRSLSGMQSN